MWVEWNTYKMQVSLCRADVHRSINAILRNCVVKPRTCWIIRAPHAVRECLAVRVPHIAGGIDNWRAPWCLYWVLLAVLTIASLLVVN